MPASRDLLSRLEAGLDGLAGVAERAPWRLGAFGLFALVTTWPLLSTAGALNEFRDAHVLGHYEWAAAEAVLRFHQAPLWDPYYCGGMYLLGTPQGRFVSPTFLLTLLFGEPRGAALTAFGMMVVGLEGTFHYARSRGASALGAMFAAPLFAASGIFALSPALGWYNFFSFELLPWVAYGTRGALAGRRSALIGTATALAWCVGFGGTYTAPMAALWCAFEVSDHLAVVLRRGAAMRRARRASHTLARASLIAIMAVALSAVRLWPIVDTLQAGQRVIGGTPGNAWAALTTMLFVGAHADAQDGPFYVGWLALPAVAFALARLRARSMILLGVLSFWLAAGYSAEPSLFSALRELPVYSSLRYPERFLIFVALALSVLAAAGITAARRLAAEAQRSAWRPVPKALARTAPAVLITTLAFAMAPLVSQHVVQARGRNLAAPPRPEAHRPFHQARGNRWALDYYGALDRGSLSCWDAYAVPESSRLRGDLLYEESLADEDAGTAVERRWSPNEVDLDVTLARPTALEVNQNWNSGWRANVGTVKSDRGLLAVDLPAGHHALALRFEPRSATGGALVSTVALGSLVAMAWSGRRRRGQRRLRDAAIVAAAVVAPCVAFGLCFANMHDAAAATFEPRDFTGESVLVDGLPDGAIRLDAKLDVGVTLEAATLSGPNPAPGQELMLELDWKREDKIPRGLGVFVHIELSKGDGMNGDHVLLSSVLALDDAPPGKTLRDVMPLFIPEDAAGKTVKVWVGMWRVRGDGTRAAVTDAGNAIVDDGRILAASFEVGAAEPQ
jgi:hypothetical protein